jgi:hypothetical protein
MSLFVARFVFLDVRFLSARCDLINRHMFSTLFLPRLDPEMSFRVILKFPGTDTRVAHDKLTMAPFSL